MPVLTVYQLSFPGGLHIGSHAGNLEESSLTLPADTLFAALVDAWRRSAGDPAPFVAPFVAAPPDPPFLLTSAFPYAGGVRFYPMTANIARLLSPDALRAHPKTLRRVHYLSEALLRRALAGHLLDDLLFPQEKYAEPAGGVALQDGRFWLTVEEIAQLPQAMQLSEGRRHALPALKIATTVRIPRVTIDRLTAASTIYHAGRTAFAAGCGLWFGVHWRDRASRVADAGPIYAEALTTAVTMLAEDGLGGERTAGYGAFRWAELPDPVALPDPAAGEVAWLLSRYHPHSEEELAGLRHARAAYHLVKVGGWLRSYDHAAVRRRKLMLLAEGSILPLAGQGVGDVVDIRPQYPQEPAPFPHPVYRYGLALGAGWQEANHA
jgi:CRISPR-associated protein Csm4